MSREGEGTPAPAKGNSAVTSKGDVKGDIKDVVTTPSPSAAIHNAKNFHLEAQEGKDPMAEADVNDCQGQSEHGVVAGAGPHARNASGASNCLSLSLSERAISTAAIPPYPDLTSEKHGPALSLKRRLAD